MTDFFEEDESVDDLVAAFNAGRDWDVVAFNTGRNWNMVSFVIPPGSPIFVRLLEVAKELGFKDTDWCEMKHEDGAACSYGPHPPLKSV